MQINIMKIMKVSNLYQEDLLAILLLFYIQKYIGSYYLCH